MAIVIFGSETMHRPRTSSLRPKRALCATSTSTTPSRAGVSRGSAGGSDEQGVATPKAGARWGPSTVRQMLRNPAYRGTACFGKTRIVRGVARQKRITRTLRMGGTVSRRDTAPRERPREEWIEIPVPAIVDEPIFRAGAGAAAREQGARPPPHDRAEPRAGTGELPQVRLRVLPHLDAVDRAQDSVISLYPDRPVATIGGSAVRHASGSAGPAGRRGVDRSAAIA